LVDIIFVVVRVFHVLWDFLAVLLGIGLLLSKHLLVLGLGKLCRVHLIVVLVILLPIVLLRRSRNLVRILLKEKGHGASKEFERNEVFLVLLAARLQKLVQLFICWVDLHVAEEGLQ